MTRVEVARTAACFSSSTCAKISFHSMADVNVYIANTYFPSDCRRLDGLLFGVNEPCTLFGPVGV
jgi:hypothetical protein